MSEQKPSVGRIVLYQCSGRPAPAIVVSVWPGDLVDLYVFPRTSEEGTGIATRIAYGTEEHQWSWPPRV